MNLRSVNPSSRLAPVIAILLLLHPEEHPGISKRRAVKVCNDVASMFPEDTEAG